MTLIDLPVPHRLADVRSSVRVCILACAIALSLVSSFALARPESGGMIEFPSFGLSVPMPAGYTRGTERSPSHACKFEVLDAAGAPQHVIGVQIVRLPAGQTIEQLAPKLAGEGGKVSKA